jgi:glycosyltransferase involved in cell wall biosynthesis
MRMNDLCFGSPERPLTISVILPVMNETWSLEQTVRVLMEENPACIHEILIVTSPKTNPASRSTIRRLLGMYPEVTRVHQQTLPYLGGALQEAFAIVRGDYTVLMASDLETDPHLVRSLIREILDGRHDIVVASRWLQSQGFQGYSVAKYLCNFLFQKIFSTLLRVPLTDLTYAFRIYRTEILKNIVWEELKHSFLFESLAKPLKLGYRVKEIPAKWIARQEGTSQNMLSAYLGYFRIGLRVAFANPKAFVKPFDVTLKLTSAR